MVLTIPDLEVGSVSRTVSKTAPVSSISASSASSNSAISASAISVVSASALAVSVSSASSVVVASAASSETSIFSSSFKISLDIFNTPKCFTFITFIYNKLYLQFRKKIFE